MSFNIQDYYKKLNEGDILLAYKGSISSELINNVLDAVESKLKDFHEHSKVRKKIYNVLVESLQNLYHHIDDLPESFKDQFDARFGVLVVSKEEGQYKISTGNFINSAKTNDLKEKIDKINLLDINELKTMYKYILNHQKLSAKGGGGLGLVDIARKTGNKLNYDFKNFNKDYYFFTLDVYISASSKSVK